MNLYCVHIKVIKQYRKCPHFIKRWTQYSEVVMLKQRNLKNVGFIYTRGPQLTKLKSSSSFELPILVISALSVHSSGSKQTLGKADRHSYSLIWKADYQTGQIIIFTQMKQVLFLGLLQIGSDTYQILLPTHAVF